MMYDKLIRQMRACCNGEPCEEVNCGFNPKSDLDCIEQLLTRGADAIEELVKKYLASEIDNTNLTGWLAEEHANQCPHYIRNDHDRGDDSLCDKWVCEVKSLPKWIPVTERLPEDNVHYVLCCGAKGGMFVGWVAVRSYDGGDKATAFVHGGNGRNITHWMPLPEPPKDGE